MFALALFPFLDATRAKLSALFHFYPTLARLLLLAFPLYLLCVYAIMGEWRAEFLALSLFDARMIPQAVRNVKIPPYMQQLVNCEGLILSLGIVAILGPKWVWGVIVIGLVLGNWMRHRLSPIFVFHKRFSPWIALGFTLYVLLRHYDDILWKFLPWCFLLIAVRYIGIFFSLLGSKLQWSSYLFLGFTGSPGVLAFALFGGNPFVLTTLLLSLVLHASLMPLVGWWYGKIFTGRDPASPLIEHIPTIELPI